MQGLQDLEREGMVKGKEQEQRHCLPKLGVLKGALPQSPVELYQSTLRRNGRKVRIASPFLAFIPQTGKRTVPLLGVLPKPRQEQPLVPGSDSIRET